jgi:hypothetical protein
MMRKIFLTGAACFFTYIIFGQIAPNNSTIKTDTIIPSNPGQVQQEPISVQPFSNPPTPAPMTNPTSNPTSNQTNEPEYKQPIEVPPPNQPAVVTQTKEAVTAPQKTQRVRRTNADTLGVRKRRS